eukprot:gene28852-32039_t
MAELQLTDALRKLLEDAKESKSLRGELREASSRACESGVVSWKALKEIVSLLNKESPPTNIQLHQLCAKSSLKLTSPTPREKSPALLARLAKLQDDLDKASYDRMVADITVGERQAEGMRDPGPLPTTQLQNTFGIHVAVTMGTFFAVCYYGSKEYLGFDELHAGLLGVLGIAFGMFLETMLLIIRSNRMTPLEEKYPVLYDEKLWAKGGAMHPDYKNKDDTTSAASATGGSAATASATESSAATASTASSAEKKSASGSKKGKST